MTTDSKGYPTWLHTAPKSQGAYNAVRRMRQITDFKWSPAVEGAVRQEYYIPAGTYYDTESSVYGFRDVTKFFSPNKEYIGIPYGYRNPVGTSTGFETFATSVSTPKTAMMENSKTILDYGSPYYGSVCSNSVCYALALPHAGTENMYPDPENPYAVPGMVKLYDLVTDGEYHDIDDLELADIVWKAGHCVMVTDLIKDGDTVSHVEISESTMHYDGKAVRRMWTRSGFLHEYDTFCVLRYTLLDTIPYYPTPYSPMPDEGNPPAYKDYNVMPYRGSKSIYTPDSGASSVSIGFVVHNVEDLNNNNPAGTLAFDSIIIEKNGQRFGDPIAVDTSKGTEYYLQSGVTVDADEANYCVYLAKLDGVGNIVKRTMPCEFVVIPKRSPTITYNTDTKEITIVATVKAKTFVPGYFATGVDSIVYSTAIHITPDMLTAVENQDGSVTYTIKYTFAADDGRTVNNVMVGYVSPEFGVQREVYSLS